MVDNDIYNSKAKYERFVRDIPLLLKEPSERRTSRGKTGKYYCKNPENLDYFYKLNTHFEAKDLSYIRRIRVFQSMMLISSTLTKNFAQCDREDINYLLAYMHKAYRSPKSKETFIADIKHIWKLLFPEKDVLGRPDDTITPYPVRHLSTKIDKSRKKIRKDKLTYTEFKQIMDYFSSDPRIQAYLSISVESLSRPQELLYRKIKNVESYDNYAKIWLTDHGKEGPGLLQCIDSYPYLLKWLNIHPQKNNPEAYIFVNTGTTNTLKQLKPSNINKMLRKACKSLNIDKSVTCYSMKRNGVTIRRKNGESGMQIQHAARWTSVDQLKTYDQTDQEDAFQQSLQKRGLAPPKSEKENLGQKKCVFCNTIAGFNEIFCPKCQRPLERQEIEKETYSKENEIIQLRQGLLALSERFDNAKKELMQDLMKRIMDIKNNASCIPKSKENVHPIIPQKNESASCL